MARRVSSSTGRRRQVSRKGRCDEYEESLPEAAKIGAVALFVLGLIMSYRFITLFSMSEGAQIYYMLDELVGISWSLEMMALAIALAGLLTITGCIGYVGIQDSRAYIMALYSFLVMLLFFLCVAMGFFTVGMDELLGNTVNHQVKHLCDPVRHYETMVLLRCSFSSTAVSPQEFSRANESCDEKCTKHIQEVRRWGGCSLLEVMCHRYTYKQLGPGDCVVDNATSPRVAPLARNLPGQVISERCCWTSCDSSLGCTGYVYDKKGENCKLVMHFLPDSYHLLHREQAEEEVEEKLNEIEDEWEINNIEGAGHPSEAGSLEPRASFEPPPVATAAPLVALGGTAERLLEEVPPGTDLKDPEALPSEAPGDPGDPGEPGEKSEEVTDIRESRKSKGERRYTKCSTVQWTAPNNMTRRMWINATGSDWRYELVAPDVVVGSTGNHSQGSCRKKMGLTVVEETIISTGIWMVVMNAFTALVLVLALVCVCVVQFHMVPRRARKRQSKWATLAQMMCPCCKCLTQPRGARGRKGKSSCSESESEYSEFSSHYSDESGSEKG